MKTLTVVAIMAIALAVAPSAMADVQAWGDLYYRISPPADTGLYRPTGTHNNWTWPSSVYNNPKIAFPTYLNTDPLELERAVTGGKVDSLSGKTLKKDSILLLGLENSLVSTWDKFVTVRILLTDTSKTLALASYSAGGTNPIKYEVRRNLHVNGEYQLLILIMPQPDWEWIAIKNTSSASVTFSEVTIGASCYPIPSLTGWGVGALVILLAGTAVWLVRRRKPVLSA